MKSFQIHVDRNGENTLAIPAPDYTQAVVLAAGVAQTVTVPITPEANNATDGTVIFSATAPFYARPNATAAVPPGAVTDGTAPMYAPAVWSLEGVATISLVAPAASIVTLSFYKR